MKPEVSIPVALATGAVVIGVYQAMTPNDADTRTVAPGSTGSDMLASSERTALYVAVGVCGGISLIAKDPIPFVVGGLLAVALSWANRYAQHVDPTTARLAGIAPGTGSLLPTRTVITQQG